MAGFAPITRHSSDRGFMHAQVDLTDVYKGPVTKAERGIAIVNSQYVVIRDEIAAGSKETTLRWTLLAAADVMIIDEASAELSRQRCMLQLQVRSPD
jgi:hypothetical protein